MRRALPRESARAGGGGGGAQPVVSVLVSCWTMSRSDAGCSHAGATMLARRCFFSSIASHRGILLRRGGRRGGVGPCSEKQMVSRLRSRWQREEGSVATRVQRTPRSSMLSSRCRGMTVTSSISHKKATSFGTRPLGNGRAIFFLARRDVMLKLDCVGARSGHAKKCPSNCETRPSGRIDLHFSNETGLNIHNFSNFRIRRKSD